MNVVYYFHICNYRWNYSVGNFEIELIEGENGNIHLDSYCGDSKDASNKFNFVMQDGVVATDKWSFKFTSPIASAWNLEDKELKTLNVFDSEQLKLGENINPESLVYLGKLFIGCLCFNIVSKYLTRLR